MAVVVHSHVVRCALARATSRDRAMAKHLPTGSVWHLAWHRDGSADLVSSETFGSTDGY